MKWIFFLIASFFLTFFCNAQNSSDTIKTTPKEIKRMSIEPAVHYYKNGKFQIRGQNLCEMYDRGGFCFPIGFWDYFYESGQLKLQDFNYCDSLSYKYSVRKLINMWVPDGTQVLKDGQGLFYYLNTTGDRMDSLVFEIKDSLQNGMYKNFCKTDSGRYMLLEYGNYQNSKRVGTFFYRDSLTYHFEDRTYEGGKEICDHRYYSSSYILREEGKRIEGFNEGLWKYYKNGVISREVNYTRGSKYGEYKEYYSNGQISVWGFYDHTNKFDPVSYGNRNSYWDDGAKPSGQWKYYKKNGTIKKTVNY